MALSFSAPSQNISEELHSNWHFRKAGDAEWMRATVPGTVHTDLLDNAKIPDPFFGDNEKSVQWIDTCDWEYETEFEIKDSTLRFDHCEISFEGLDTYAHVFLNDKAVLSADNMFRTWKVDCKKYLLPGKNKLRILFDSATRVGKKEAQKLPYVLPGDEKVFTRKAQYQYGWDWGPRLITCGIWKPVKLICWNSFRVKDVHLITEKLTDSMALVVADVAVSTDRATTIDFQMSVKESSRYLLRTKIRLMPGEQNVKLNFEIKNPKRWWSNGLGDASLYHFTIQAKDSLRHLSTKYLSYGLRTIELVREKDKGGKSFFFKLNGIPVFIKGANWIPADNFLPRVTQEKYRGLLLAAKDANMNMLRVWGGGVYEEDSFYSLCDSLGILVWQDFMFACAMYPGDPAFIENVKAEVEDNVLRLRNHPCMAMWCGNNEIDEGWNNWGWQNQFKYTAQDSSTIWKNYLEIFHEAIPGILGRLDSSRAYWESSPSIGWGHTESLKEGDSHYWGVWWGMEPFEMYNKRTGRFMSEYGFQGMPSLQAIESFTTAAERNISSASIRNHQKHPTGYETIDRYMDGWYKKPKNFESYDYLSQLLQAEGMRTAIEAHRRAKPYCMGSLYWQFNDCWPVTSWSSIDYSGQWKAVQYAVKESFEKYLITIDDTGKLFSVYVVSDDTGFKKATLLISIEDFGGNILWRDSALTYLSQERATVVYKSSVENISGASNPLRTFLKLDLVSEGKHLASKIYYLSKPKELLLDKPAIQFTVKTENDLCTITLFTSTLAKNIFLVLENEDVHFSRNYFDLLPGQSATVTFRSTLDAPEIQRKLIVRSLVDSF